MKISQKHILLFLASRFGSQAVNVTLTNEAMGPYDNKAAAPDEAAAPYIADTDEPMGLKGGYASWNTTMDKSGGGKGTGKSGSKGGYGYGYAKSKSGSKSGAKYGDGYKYDYQYGYKYDYQYGYKYDYQYGYKYDYQYGYNEGYTKKTMKPTPAPGPPCSYLKKLRVNDYTNFDNIINDNSGNFSMVTFGISPVVNYENLTEKVAIHYGTCILAPNARTSGKVFVCEITFEFSSKDSLFFKFKTQECPGVNTTGFNGVVVAGTGCLCGTEGSIFKGTTVSNEYAVYDLSTLGDSCGYGGWNDTELDQFSCPS